MPVEEQIVVIEHAHRLLAVNVCAKELLEIVFPRFTPRKVVGQDLGQFLSGVEASAINIHAGSFLEEPFVGLAEVQFRSDDVHQILGIGPIVDGKLGRQSDRLAEASQEPRGDGMEGAAPNFRAGRNYPSIQRALTGRGSDFRSRRGCLRRIFDVGVVLVER